MHSSARTTGAKACDAGATHGLPRSPPPEANHVATLHLRRAGRLDEHDQSCECLETSNASPSQVPSVRRTCVLPAGVVAEGQFLDRLGREPGPELKRRAARLRGCHESARAAGGIAGIRSVSGRTGTRTPPKGGCVLSRRPGTLWNTVPGLSHRVMTGPPGHRARCAVRRLGPETGRFCPP